MSFNIHCQGAHGLVEHLEAAVRESLCTAWSVACRDWRASAFYADEWFPGRQMPPHPVFDLASLTKPLFLPELFLAAGFGPVQWGESRDFLHGRSLSELRDHTSGAAAWFWMGRGGWIHKESEALSRGHFEAKTMDEVRRHALRFLTQEGLKALDTHPRGATVYSDVNYFLLARAYEELAGPLTAAGLSTARGSAPKNTERGGPEFWESALAKLNAEAGTDFHHASLGGSARRPRVLPFFPYLSVETDAALDGPEGAVNFGPVHDTNANILASRLGGIVSGHAGLLGSVADVDKILPRVARRPFLLAPERSHGRFLAGLDTPSGPTSTAGLRAADLPGKGRVVGHLGYTGTSFWLAQEKEELQGRHILLMNRTAHRTRFGGAVPRLLVFTSTSGEWIWGGRSQAPGQGWEELPEEDWREAAREHTLGRRLLWNTDLLRPVPDVSVVRRRIGLMAWDE